MITRKFTGLFLLRMLALAWLSTFTAEAQMSARMSSQFLAQGEQGIFEISIAGDQPDFDPIVPEIPQVGIRSLGHGTYPRRSPSSRGRRFEHVYQYSITSYTEGVYIIPPIEISVSGVKTRSEPISFQIFNPNQLQWSEAKLGNRSIRYAAAFMTLKNRPYEGENINSEIKLYVPRELAENVPDWGVPEFQRDGIASWRFELSDMPGQLHFRSGDYLSRSYPSTMAATRTGKVVIGPATVTLTTIQLVMGAYAQRGYEPVVLDIPALELDAQPLPSGAPAGFDNAIGNFSIQSFSSETEVHEGEPVSVDIVVSGSGNLDTMRAPKLVNEDGWKVYDPIANQRGDERRELSGDVTYHQLMRPLELQPSIPSFRLVFFDPADSQYHTINTDPIPLKMLPSANPGSSLTGPPQAMPMPVEQMTDILAVITPAQLTMPGSLSMPGWLGHVFGGLLALTLIAKAFWMKLAPRMRKDQNREDQKKALADLERMKPGDDIGFLKSAGGFIEKWLGNRTDPEIQEILAERDKVCFRVDSPPDALPQPRRKEIVGILRKATLMLALLFTLGATVQPANAADGASEAMESYNSANYENAIKEWLAAGDYNDLSPDVLYNIGNACYRLGSPGNAALYYRRALDCDPSHAEARQNLRFIERKYGSITIEWKKYQYAISSIPLAAWKAGFWTGAWLCVLGLLVFPATQSGAKLRIAAVSSLIAGPILLSTGALGWRHFPDDAKFADLDRQAVIVDKDVVVHVDAARTSPTVIDAPPGSLCEVLRESGRWVYVSFATQTRGWILKNTLEKIIPESAPEPPKLRKLPGDDSNA